LEINPFIIYKVIKKKNNPLKFLCAKILIRLHLSTFFTINRGGHYLLKFFPSAYSRALWIDPTFRIKSEENFFRDYLIQNDNVIDVGANIGTITLTCAKAIGKYGRLLSFEAHPKIFSYLKGNIQLNKLQNIDIHNIALSNENGFVNFSDAVSDGQNKILKNSSGIKVPSKKLDDFNFFENKISLLKIDVEGFELNVFKGSEKTLGSTNCIYFECVERLYQNYGYSFNDLFDFLINHDYKIYKFIQKQIKEISKSSKLQESQNLLAIKNLEEFLQRTNYELIS
jgi:FkbM family methyltransferase